MTIVYQGNSVETSATSVAAFLAERGIDAATAIVEYKGEVYGKNADLASLALSDGAELNTFKIVSGG